jgi:hypothetical protein
VLCLCCGCGALTKPEVVDAGGADAGEVDSGSLDAGSADAGRGDLASWPLVDAGALRMSTVAGPAGVSASSFAGLVSVDPAPGATLWLGDGLGSLYRSDAGAWEGVVSGLGLLNGLAHGGGNEAVVAVSSTGSFACLGECKQYVWLESYPRHFDGLNVCARGSRGAVVGLDSVSGRGEAFWFDGAAWQAPVVAENLGSFHACAFEADGTLVVVGEGQGQLSPDGGYVAQALTPPLPAGDAWRGVRALGGRTWAYGDALSVGVRGPDGGWTGVRQLGLGSDLFIDAVALPSGDVAFIGFREDQVNLLEGRLVVLRLSVARGVWELSEAPSLLRPLAAVALGERELLVAGEKRSALGTTAALWRVTW